MKYGLDEKPGLLPLLLYGLQWWVATLPSLIIMGMVVVRLHFPGLLAEQVAYMQKLFWLLGAVTVVQVLWGHRLPLVVGPASTLLVGLVASASAGINAMYTAILLGGALLAIAAATGALSKLRVFFTPRIVAVILALIAFTLSPTILRLLLGDFPHASFNLCFALVMVFVLVLCNARLPGAWKSLTVFLGVGAGSLAHFLAFGFPALPALSATDEGMRLFITALEFHPGAILSFFFCFLALTINELGSIEAVGHMLEAGGMDGRIRRGAGLQGVAGMAAGALGVIGPVDFSLSAGLITATGCASRYTLVPAGIALALCGFFPRFVLLLSCIPGPVMGALLLYLMATQLASGLTLLVRDKGITDFTSGTTVGLPLMIGLLISFAPPAALNGFPEFLRPVIGNGFVMGTIAVIALEHGVFRKKTAE